MDLVSSLPDEIRCHILSFLPTKQAVLTSALSKRWLNLWTLVRNLDIDDTVFLHPEEDGNKAERVEIRQSFVEFVDRVLAFQGDSPIEKFSLKCIGGVHPDCVNRWICNVLHRGVSDLDLFVEFYFNYDEENYRLPYEIFVNRTLVNLKLRREACVLWWRGETATFLPMLKSLYIDSNMIFCDKMESLLPCFPVLEELRMAKMEWSDSDQTVSSASLRKLSIDGTCDEDFVKIKSISFDTPNLLYLNYSDLVAEDYPLVKMEKLVEAHINLIVSTEDQIDRVRALNDGLIEDDEDAVDDGDAVDDVVLHFGNVVKLMTGIKNIQKLYLNHDTLEVLSLCCESMPLFNNLKTLAIQSEKNRGWQAMPVLIRKCPHLETLIIEGLLHYVTEKCGDACVCIFREEKGRSLTSCPVKMIEIRGFRGTMKEMGLIKHFLDYLLCLNEMNIYLEEEKSTELIFPEVAALIQKMMDDYNELYRCNVQFVDSEHDVFYVWRSGVHNEISEEQKLFEI